MTGYESKKAAAIAKTIDEVNWADHEPNGLSHLARDKLLDDDDTLTIAYQSGYYDGKKAAAQEPTKYSFKAHWEEDGCIGVVAAIERLDGGVHLLKDTIDAPSPAQEPVAHLCGPDENGLFGLPTEDKACKACFPVYRQSPQRPWVKLPIEAILEFANWLDNREEEVGWVSPSEIVAYIDAQLKEKNNAA